MGTTRMPMQQSDAKAFKSEYVLSFGCLARPP
nr:MAG TPA: Muscular LMNA-interacting protein [Caudoviricetes sp.]